MPDEENPVLVLLNAMRAEMNAKFDHLTARADRTDIRLERMGSKLEHMDNKLNRAASRADDVMTAQVKMQTDITAIRATLEDGGRSIVREFREDILSLQDRVEKIEQR